MNKIILITCAILSTSSISSALDVDYTVSIVAGHEELRLESKSSYHAVVRVDPLDEIERKKLEKMITWSTPDKYFTVNPYPEIPTICEVIANKGFHTVNKTGSLIAKCGSKESLPYFITIIQ